MRTIIKKMLLLTLPLGVWGQVSTGESNAVDLSIFKPKVEEVPVQVQPKRDSVSTEVVKAQNSESDLEENLPVTTAVRADAIAVIIGNSEYQKTKNVDYAVNDARTMKLYLEKVLGFKEGNIFYYENATKTDFEILFGNKDSYKGKLYNAVKPEKSDVFVFYSGHGAPDLENFNGYFVPVDSDPNYIIITGYNSEVFYSNLAKIPSRSTTVVLDACFSGANILEGISPVGIKPKNFSSIPNGVLFSSSSGTQVSSWYEEKQHGMFTYFFLKAIQDFNADYNEDKKITADEIHQYVSDQSEGVPYYARRYRNVEQTPTLQGARKDMVIVEY